MATTIEQLERRVTALEQELALLRERLASPSVDETPAERDARLVREGREEHARMVAAWEKAMEAMGIRGEPVGAERLPEMMRAEGIRPEDNEFSRGIIEMREE